MSWKEFENASRAIVYLLKSHHVTSIYGIPRGGLPLAVKLSHLMNLKLIINEKKITDTTLVVDDIADTGRTLFPYKDYTTATIYYHPKSKIIPTVWIYEKANAWVVFPWENVSVAVV